MADQNSSPSQVSKFEELLEKAAVYQELASENYDRVRRIAEGIQSGFCKFLNSSDGACVRLVPPQGPFQPKLYGDEAFSMPSRGFRHIAPIAFGLAVRVTHETDWIRAVLICSKQGEHFNVAIMEGQSHDFELPFTDDDHQEFYQALFQHFMDWLDERIDNYREGSYSRTSIGFDFSDESHLGDGLAPDVDSLTAAQDKQNS